MAQWEQGTERLSRQPVCTPGRSSIWPEPGDAAALKIVNRVAQTLADAVANISLVLNPELIVLGGGVGAHPVLCEATKKLVDKNEFARPRVTTSTLGTQAQIYGTIYNALTAVECTLL